MIGGAPAALARPAVAPGHHIEATFRATVARLVNLMFERHAVVLTLTNSGGRRTFHKQYELATQADAKKVTVGRATEIRAGGASVSAAEIAQVMGVPLASMKPADPGAMCHRLRDEFIDAEASWDRWAPVDER